MGRGGELCGTISLLARWIKSNIFSMNKSLKLQARRAPSKHQERGEWKTHLYRGEEKLFRALSTRRQVQFVFSDCRVARYSSASTGRNHGDL